MAPFEADELETTVWDFDRRSTLDDHAAVFTRMAAGVYYEWAPDRCRSYALMGDTLIYRGYNAGRYERMILDCPAPARIVGGAATGGFGSEFTARGLLYDRFATRETGSLQASDFARGCMVIGGDTLAVVIEREVTESLKYYDGDSTAVAERAEILRWLRPGDIHPLALQIKTGDSAPRLFAVDEARLEDIIQVQDDSEVRHADADITAVLESAVATRTAEGLAVSFGAAADVPFMVDVY
ncbi:MAG: hypothetical protein K2F72_06240, partial [Muribaculaceae bacterium]|nr:hypothetical protein [Muribaculaceae bacterium]